MHESYGRAKEFDDIGIELESQRLDDLEDALEDATTDEHLIEKRSGRLARALLHSVGGSLRIRSQREREIAIDRVFALCIPGADAKLEGDDSDGRYQRILRQLIGHGFPVEVAPSEELEATASDALDDDITF